MPLGYSSLRIAILLCFPDTVVTVQTMGFRRDQSVFLDLIEQRAITDAEQPCGCLAVPVGLFERTCDGAAFGLAFCISYQRLQRRLFFTGGVAVLPVLVSVSIAMPIRRGGAMETDTRTGRTATP